VLLMICPPESQNHHKMKTIFRDMTLEEWEQV
jgi:hypothetical protein